MRESSNTRGISDSKPVAQPAGERAAGLRSNGPQVWAMSAVEVGIRRAGDAS
jgi:hypothetical protein